MTSQTAVCAVIDPFLQDWQIDASHFVVFPFHCGSALFTRNPHKKCTNSNSTTPEARPCAFTTIVQGHSASIVN